MSDIIHANIIPLISYTHFSIRHWFQKNCLEYRSSLKVIHLSNKTPEDEPHVIMRLYSTLYMQHPPYLNEWYQRFDD
jgi:hypothetical protein